MSLSPRATLVTILCLFLLPLLLAWFMYDGTLDMAPTNKANHGNLVEPPVSLSWSDVDQDAAELSSTALEGHWVILYPAYQSCGRECIDDITQLRQVHVATGRNQDRVRIALLFDVLPQEPQRSELLKIHPRFVFTAAPSTLFTQALQQIQASQSAGNRPAFYLVDPLGNIMMTYGREHSMSDLNKDLKRLLTWSKLDNR